MILADSTPDAATVTPGIAGFLTFFALAVIVVLLVLNMSKHLRRIDARAAQQEAEEAAAREAAGREAESDDDADGGPAESPADVETEPSAAPEQPGASPGGERER